MNRDRKRPYPPACSSPLPPEQPPAGVDAAALLPYQRARFQTLLPIERLYSPQHFWVRREAGDICRVGFTRFAVRAIGELIEHDWEVKTGAAVHPGQVLGWVEGFKATTDIHCAAAGRFLGGNAELAVNLGLIAADPYGRGWLYSVHGEPAPGLLDVHGYVQQLDVAIDRASGTLP
jgi:glycine cleavage system H protein